MRFSFFKRWPILMLSLIIAIGVTVMGVEFFIRAKGIMEQQLMARLEATAGAAALYVDGATLDAIHGAGDKHTPAFIDLVHRLKSMRTLQNIHFAYILRRTQNPMQLEFIADADSLSTPTELDVNHDGIVTPDEEPSNPGDLYDISALPVLQKEAFLQPSSDTDITYDKSGPLISGYAPVRRSDGTVAGVLGIDMRAQDFSLVSQSIFTPVALLIVVFIGLLCAGLIVYLWEQRRIAFLNRVNSERSGLLHLTFHQLGEPLTIMKWSLETLRDAKAAKEMKEMVKEHISCMDEGLGRLNSIIDTLQQAEKVDLNKLEYLPTLSSLKNLLENAVREWQWSADKQNQTLVIDIPSDIKFRFDHNMIALVLRQLIQNATEYSPNGSTITVKAVPDKKSITISVEDHGYGIPKEDVDRLFEKYRRASNAPLHKPDGNGLGLYIAKGIVERAGGKIWIVSSENKGTTISFTLPMLG